jgi:ABC-2 type transport system permease protein
MSLYARSARDWRLKIDKAVQIRILPSVFDASVAQLVEQQTLNLFVHGSSPCRGTIFKHAHFQIAHFQIAICRGWFKFSPGGRMKKYLHVINIGLQSNLAYRFNYLTRTLFSFIPLFAMISLWQKIGGAQNSGWTQAEIVFYYILVAVVDVFTAVNEDDWQIAADIREGNISQFLLKPVDYLWYRLCLFVSGRIAFIAVAAVPLAIFIFCFRQYVLPPASAVALPVFLVSLVLTALLQFFISYAMAMLAFWLLEISTFIFILFAFEYLASGHLFPLDILPPHLKQILFLTPFPYQMYFPVSIYLGKAAGVEMWRGLVVQFLWVIAAYVFARFMWRRGIKKYSAFGG